MRAKMESDEVLTWDDRCIYIYQAREGSQCRSRAVRTLAQALEEVEASMTGTRRLASGQALAIERSRNESIGGSWRCERN